MVPQGSALSLALVNIFVNYLDEKIDLLIKFTDFTKLGGVEKTADCRESFKEPRNMDGEENETRGGKLQDSTRGR